MPIANLDDFAALEPFFQIIKDGLGDLVDDVHFFDILSKDVVVDYVITVPGYPAASKAARQSPSSIARTATSYSSTAASTSRFTATRRPERSCSSTRPKAEQSKTTVRTRTAMSRC